MVWYFGWPFGSAREERRSCYSFFFPFAAESLKNKGWGISLFSLAGLKVDKGNIRVKERLLVPWSWASFLL